MHPVPVHRSITRTDIARGLIRDWLALATLREMRFAAWKVNVSVSGLGR